MEEYEPVEEENQVQDIDTEYRTCHCGYFCYDCLDVCEEDFL